jgi:hypothetical protein
VRWPNGDISFVSARTEEDVIVMLNQWDDAEAGEIRLNSLQRVCRIGTEPGKSGKGALVESAASCGTHNEQR